MVHCMEGCPLLRRGQEKTLGASQREKVDLKKRYATDWIKGSLRNTGVPGSEGPIPAAGAAPESKEYSQQKRKPTKSVFFAKVVNFLTRREREGLVDTSPEARGIPELNREATENSVLSQCRYTCLPLKY